MSNKRSQSGAAPDDGPSFKKPKLEKWGSDSDDEILLLASQACERKLDVCVSTIAGDAHLQNLLRQLTAFRGDVDRLRGERDSLTDRCLAKDGEVSILRAQLKNAQTQLAAERVEKVRRHELAQIDWSERLRRADERTQTCASQLDFKNLEIMHLRERCKVLEASKIKFSEPEAAKWNGSSQRIGHNNSSKIQSKSYGISTAENSTQYNLTSKNVQLFVPPVSDYPLMEAIENCIFVNSMPDVPLAFLSNRYSHLEERSNLHRAKSKLTNDPDAFLFKNRVKLNQDSLKITNIYKHIAKIRNNTRNQLNNDDDSVQSQLTITFFTKLLLLRTHKQLEELENKLTVFNIREMDEQYFDVSGENSVLLTKKCHFDENCWFKNEQAIEARRALSTVAKICKYSTPLVEHVLGISKSKHYMLDRAFKDLFQCNENLNENFQDEFHSLLLLLKNICEKIGKIGCSHLYTPLLSSLCNLLKSCIENSPSCDVFDIVNILKTVILLRPHIIVLKDVTDLILLLSSNVDAMKTLCDGSSSSNLMLNLNEGVAIYDINTCRLQLLCNNVEVWLPHFKELIDMDNIFTITHNIIKIYRAGTSLNLPWIKCYSEKGCLCAFKIGRCICACLFKCTTLYKKYMDYLKDQNILLKFNSTIKAGIMVLNFCILNNVEFISHLGDYEGHYQQFVAMCNKLTDNLQLLDIHKEALADLSDNILPVSEDTEVSTEMSKFWDQIFTGFSINE